MPIVPFSLKDAPSFIEHAFPAQRISIEAQTERKANAGQTLTALGSYWKGRKPLVLVRACVLGALLPATSDIAEDLEIFELLMAMDDAAFANRVRNVSREDIERYGTDLADLLFDGQGKWKVKGLEKAHLLGQVLVRMPYSERLDRRSLRPEELPARAYEDIWTRVNRHLGTAAASHSELVEQLGIMRFGHRVKVADTFAGGGSIPFEAARLGCDVVASDLNPIAAMLTWGAANVIGGDEEARRAMRAAQQQVAATVDAEVTRLGLEHDAGGNRAKAHLYCLEVTCPETGWRVPLAPSWVISRNQRVVARLAPNAAATRFDIEIIQDATDDEIAEAAKGTVRGPDMVYMLDGVERRTAIMTLRGERKVGGETINDLRRWTRGDFVARDDDSYRELLYCIQWIDAANPRRVFFRAPSADDVDREARVEELVRRSLPGWQSAGLVPDMAIEDGKENEGPIRTRGWTYWHHLFPPRHLLYWSLFFGAVRQIADARVQAMVVCTSMNAMDRSSKLGQWRVGFVGRAGVAPSSDRVEHVFYSQALHTFYSYGIRLWAALQPVIVEQPNAAPIAGTVTVQARPAAALNAYADLFITDPPYADAVRYEEITEFFIAWLRRHPPAPFADWSWDSRRDLAIKGKGDAFRREMVNAYSAMAKHMPDNGMQIVMFTHQDGGVWADMANIFWGAGLKVTAAWYIATETTSELKKGGYVQGTVILVLRKRMGHDKTYTNEVVEEVRKEVAHQIETLTGLNQTTRAGRDENLFNDADLQMAGYAAALRVLTAYTHIDDHDMTREALRPRVAGEESIAGRIIDHAVAIANEYLVPEDLDAKIWDRLSGSERFYVRMLDVEEAGAKKLDSYQNFAKAFKVRDFAPLMASQKPNDARLKSAKEFKKSEFSGSEFAGSTLRVVLFALYELQTDVEPDEVMSHLRDGVADYLRKRDLVAALARYLDAKLAKLRPDEAQAARVLTALVKNERIGG